MSLDATILFAVVGDLHCTAVWLHNRTNLAFTLSLLTHNLLGSY